MVFLRLRQRSPRFSATLPKPHHSVLRVSPAGGAPQDRLTNHLAATLVEFEVGEPSLKELENSCFVGNGRFLLEDEKFYVEMRVSKLVASTDMD